MDVYARLTLIIEMRAARESAQRARGVTLRQSARLRYARTAPADIADYVLNTDTGINEYNNIIRRS